MAVIEREELNALLVSYCKFGEVDKRFTQKWLLLTNSSAVGLQLAQRLSYLCNIH
jgi:hypothetical protein